MSKDNKTNFLLTPTYSSDMMANSQDEKKKLSNGEKTQLPVSNERKTTRNTGPKEPGPGVERAIVNPKILVA